MLRVHKISNLYFSAVREYYLHFVSYHERTVTAAVIGCELRSSSLHSPPVPEEGSSFAERERERGGGKCLLTAAEIF